MNEQGELGVRDGEGGLQLPAKVVQVVESRKVWAVVIGLATTLALWGVGEIDGARAIEAMTWVLGIFIGAVALEDGMTRLFSTLAHAVVSDSSLHAGDPDTNPNAESKGSKVATTGGDDGDKAG